MHFSNYSDVITYTTAGNVPTAPAAPILRNATVNGLHLAWVRRQGDEEFVLQMDDRNSNYGYLAVYHGRETHHYCDNLRRHSEYRFRVSPPNGSVFQCLISLKVLAFIYFALFIISTVEGK